MCGIISYLGPQDAAPIIMRGLKRMEYRGYDSAGVISVNKDGFSLQRAAGKLDNLTTKLEDKEVKGSLAMGHTRWATHGEPTEANAHPHRCGRIALVHNGIIENYAEIRKELQGSGVKFASETDTEVLGQLINKLYDKSNSLETAVYGALKRVRGAFGVVILASDQPDVMIAARRASPIVIGVGKDETLIASDAAALVEHTNKVIYLDDDEVAICRAGEVKITDLKQSARDRDPETLDMEIESIQKQGYDHYLLKEIMEQPKSLTETLRGHLDFDKNTTHFGGLNLDDDSLRGYDRILIVGCGTAYYAGMLAKYMIERFSDIAVDVEIGSEFRYRDPTVNPDNTLGVAVSQSGETADTLASVQEMQRRGMKVMGLVNVIGSTIARQVDGGMYLHVGPEISVASTKAFTSQVVSSLMLGIHIARLRGLQPSKGLELIKALDDLPSEIEETLKLGPLVAKIAKEFSVYENALYMGRDVLFPIALEGALKLKEVSYLHAEAYPSGEMKHGPIALIDEKFMSIHLIGKGALSEKAASNLQEVKARGGPVLVVTDDEALKDEPDTIFIKTKHSFTAPLVMNVALQLLAYHVAVARGTDVDQPRNLAKSVTVE